MKHTKKLCLNFEIKFYQVVFYDTLFPVASEKDEANES